MGIAPHSLRAVTAESLRIVLDAWPAGPIHIHAAEQTREVDDCLAALGRRDRYVLNCHVSRWNRFGLDARGHG